MGADILERLELMLHARLTDEDTIIREAAAEIGRLRGEVAMTEQQKADRDLLLTGTSFMRDGKRIDPATVRIETPAAAMPNGVEASREQFNAWMKTRGVISSWQVQQDMWNAWTASRAADNRDAAGVDSEEDAYVIERMGKLLAEIAVIVNGPEPAATRWSYHDLPEKVRALKTTPPAAQVQPPHCPDCGAGALYECPACSSTNYPTCEAAQRADGEAVGTVMVVPSDDSAPVQIGWHRDIPPVGTKLYTTPPAPVQAAPQEGEGYYLASFKHKANNGEVMWWKGDNAGYSPDLEQAGIYTELVPGYHDSEDTVPVPVAFLAGLRVRRTVDPGDSLNHMFWSAKTLRAALQHRGDSRGGEGSGG